MITVFILYPFQGLETRQDVKTIEINNMALYFDNTVYYHSCINIFIDERKIRDLDLANYSSYDLVLILVPYSERLEADFKAKKFDEMKPDLSHDDPITFVGNNSIETYLDQYNIKHGLVEMFKGYVTHQSDIHFRSARTNKPTEGEEDFMIEKIITEELDKYEEDIFAYVLCKDNEGTDYRKMSPIDGDPDSFVNGLINYKLAAGGLLKKHSQLVKKEQTVETLVFEHIEPKEYKNKGIMISQFSDGYTLIICYDERMRLGILQSIIATINKQINK